MLIPSTWNLVWVHNRRFIVKIVRFHWKACRVTREQEVALEGLGKLKNSWILAYSSNMQLSTSVAVIRARILTVIFAHQVILHIKLMAPLHLVFFLSTLNLSGICVWQHREMLFLRVHMTINALNIESKDLDYAKLRSFWGFVKRRGHDSMPSFDHSPWSMKCCSSLTSLYQAWQAWWQSHPEQIDMLFVSSS